ncbi:Holliday junction branch migration protein RuvA [Fusibacter tunisiensis]|uniref:Holliday junction branch migration complex subunit RuvA n=1 Tax=Fusibacter tunisiensis TaxID=1008308 RepID=A0ABS2MQF6_9FIRM|nr:Holliday junction branch migration protein RuvA [Fusibacter tunisiensis]MBM7561629.1 Holliday junction DNA helicase RuvA [Fusibacter tunisiensis]
MFDYIKGKLIHVDLDSIVVENQGIGFKVFTSAPSISDFSVPGEEVILFTEMIVREDLIMLVGFSTREELRMFHLLTSVSGVGTKVAMGILSSLPYGHLAASIASKDIKSLTSAQGVGKKTAERIVLELKDKVGGFAGFENPQPLSPERVGKATSQSDALEALLTLGYTRSEAQGVLKNMDLEDMTVEQVIKAALLKMMNS